MYRTQINANVPIQKGSGQIIVDLPDILHLSLIHI